MDPINVFISYSHRDKELKLLFETHLKGLGRILPLNIWSDLQIVPGTEWNHDIFSRLEHSQLVLLLISPDFVASEFCYAKELSMAMENHEKRKSMVIPVYLRPGNYDDLIFTKVQTLPEPEPLKPTRPRSITEWSNLDAAFQNVMQGIEKAVDFFVAELQKRNPVTRKDEIEQYIIMGNHDKACNRLMDFVNDFSSNKLFDIKKMIAYKSSLYTINDMMKKKEEASGESIELGEILKAREELTMNLLELLYGILLPSKLAA